MNVLPGERSKVSSILPSFMVVQRLWPQRAKSLLNFVLGPVLFLLIAFSIYRQVSAQPGLSDQWQAISDIEFFNRRGILLGLAAIGLMLLNWCLEAFKWRMMVNHLMPLNFTRALLSVLAGLSFTMLTPNRMGEFLGRLLYMPNESRFRAASLTALSSLSQLIVTVGAGIAGFLYLQNPLTDVDRFPLLLSNALVFGLLLFLIVALIIYFNVGAFIRWIEPWPAIRKYTPLIHAIGQIERRELAFYLLLSALRYAVFILQYALFFHLFHIHIAWQPLVAATATLFLILAMVPTISLAELGVRGQASLFVYGMFSQDSVGILLAAGLVWVINIVLPAFAGSLILLSVKLFDKSSPESA
jgi:hypothetical protein